MEIVRAVFAALFGTVFAENLIFSRAFGADAAAVVSGSRKKTVGFSAAVTYMCTLTNICVWGVGYYFGGDPDYEMYRPIFYICILCLLYFASVMAAWAIFKKKSRFVIKYLHFAVFNSAVLGTMLLSAVNCLTLGEYVLYGFGAGLGYSLALYMTSGVFEMLNSEKIPEALRGFPVTMIYLGIIGMAFYGITGVKASY